VPRPQVTYPSLFLVVRISEEKGDWEQHICRVLFKNWKRMEVGSGNSV